MRPQTAVQRAQVAQGLTADAAYRAAGLMIVSIFPALFWTGVIALTGSAFGQPPSVLALATLGAGIAAFLAAVAHALFSRLS